MRKFTASMISEGNHLFQTSISILENGIKVRIPNFWRDQETFFNFQDITGISLNTPSWYSVLTYSSISFNARGTWVEAHGFTKSDAKIIKRLIEEGERTNHSLGGGFNINEFGQDTSKFSERQQKDWINYQHDREVKKDREEWIERENERNKELIPKLKDLIIDNWIDILNFGNNNDYDDLDLMESPPHNKSAKKDLKKYIDNLEKILKDLYDDYWEIENNSINKEIWEIISLHIKNKDNSKRKSEIEENAFEFPSLDKLIEDAHKMKAPLKINLINDLEEKGLEEEEEDSKALKQKEIKKLIKKYDDLDVDILEDEDEIEKNKTLATQFVNKCFTKKGRNYIKDLLSEIDNDEENDFTDRLKNFLSLINKIYASDVIKLVDKNGAYKYPYALDNEKVKDFLKSRNNPIDEKMTRIIDLTDHFIDRIEKAFKEQKNKS